MLRLSQKSTLHEATAKRWRPIPGSPVYKVAIIGLLGLLAVFGSVSPSFADEAGRRVALVIGNQDYRHVEALANPVADTEEIARVLKQADFAVTSGSNLSKEDMERVVRKFLRELRDGDTALFYYSGHALQVGDANFLLPVDARLESQYDLEFESVKVSHLLDYMKAASSLQIVMLDACRDNPFEIASLFWGQEEHELGETRGLRRIPNKLGAFISYATRPGQVAYDGAGRMSPFTSSVVKHALDPALEIKDLMTRVRDDVVRNTGGKQIPYEDSTLVTDFYFVPPKPAPIVVAHHRVTVAEGTLAQPLSIPEPVQPEGGELSAVITLAPENGRLELAIGTKVNSGDAMSVSDLAGLSYVPGEGAAGLIELIGYEVHDAWGGSAAAIASVTVSENTAAETETADESVAEAGIADLIAALKSRSGSDDIVVDIGVGPKRIYSDLPGDLVEKRNEWIKVAAVNGPIQLVDGARPLQAGDKFALLDLKEFGVVPDVGSENISASFSLELPATPGSPAERLTQSIRPSITRCDQLATQPFDLQAVTEGLLANDLRPADIKSACASAMEAYPAIGRFAFLKGRGAFAEGDLKTASELFEVAYQKGHVRAGQVLGRMHFLGAGIDRDKSKAVQLYRNAAERGDAYALHSLGMAEIKGEGTAENESAGLEKLLQSVEAGHTFSFNALGGFYLRGEHVDKDINRAIYYFNRSAARNDIYGFLNMGTLYRDGVGVPQDHATALSWFRKAHEGGHPAAGTAIGLLYFNGTGVEKSDAKATKWFRESAKRGDPWGAYNTAFMLGRQSGSEASRDRARMLAMAVAIDPASQVAKKAATDLKKMSSRAKSAVLQSSLATLGFDPGPVDGRPGRKTNAALSSFFSESNLTPVRGDQALVAVVKSLWEQDRPRYDLF